MVFYTVVTLGRTVCSLDGDVYATGRQIKAKLGSITGNCPCRQKLMVGHAELKDDAKLDEHASDDDSLILTMVCRAMPDHDHAAQAEGFCFKCRKYAGFIDVPVAIGFHTNGTYGIYASGKSARLPQNSSWQTNTIAIPISDETLFVLNGTGIYKVSVDTGAHEKVCGSTWNEARAVLRCKRDPAHVLCLHSSGAYKINIATGAHRIVGRRGGWSGTRGCVYDPESDHAVVLHSNGIYKVDRESGAYTALKTGFTEGWLLTNGAVYHPSGALVFHEKGTFRVNLCDGSRQNLGGHWPTAEAAVKLGVDSALVLTQKGRYQVNLVTGESQHVSDSSKSVATCVKEALMSIAVDPYSFQGVPTRWTCVTNVEEDCMAASN